ncbi:MAG TPA: Crp/Fnr family transcriptional regulator [Flavipsychrobacter sp.]|jgi:CRP/FNR family transcriptional regulator|nr:Crp/Fnr family transcriptional regulator [Flavipsychrobacter sp.]
MQIDYNILITYGGYAKRFEKDTIIFHEGDSPNYFYQILEGEVKVYTSNNEGKNLTQAIFKAGDSFGEAPLLLAKPYPSSAQAQVASVVIRMPKERLLEILMDYPEITHDLLFTFANRLYSKAKSAQVWVSPTPEEKIMHFLKNIQNTAEQKMQQIPFTRQQIAEFTGLRVETVIRTILRMNKEKKVKLLNHKIYF